MALTKAQVKEILSAAGIPEENMEQAVTKIMNGHITSIDALREQRDEYKADAEKLAVVQKELNDLKAKGDADWEKRYSDEHAAFEEFKQQIETGRVTEQKKALYKNLLKKCNVEESRIPAILKITDFDTITLKDDKIENADDLQKSIEEDYAGFIMHKGTKGAGVQTPPDGGKGNGGQSTSRAKELEKKYHADLYGDK